MDKKNTDAAPEEPIAEPTSPVEAPLASEPSQDSAKALANRLEAMEQQQLMLLTRLEELSLRNEALENSAKQPQTAQLVMSEATLQAFQDATVAPPRKPIDLKKEGFSGEFVSEAHPGVTFGLKTHNPDRYGNTHTLKSQEHTWQGDKKQFKEAFEKK